MLWQALSDSEERVHAMIDRRMFEELDVLKDIGYSMWTIKLYFEEEQGKEPDIEFASGAYEYLY